MAYTQGQKYIVKYYYNLKKTEIFFKTAGTVYQFFFIKIFKRKEVKTMAINYTIIERKSLVDETAPVKYYALTKRSGEMTLRQLANRISNISTVSSVDTMAVLEALLKVIPEELAEGRIVRLGDFGSFFTTAKSDGVENEKDFNESLILKTNIKFRPGHEVKNALNNFQYKKIKLN